MDELVDWLIDKNKSGYQMVNSVPRLQEMKALCGCHPASTCAARVGMAMAPPVA
jgi:hypothetical protein